MPKKTYTIEKTTPRLGKAGDTVTMTERGAKYWLLSGVISDPAKAASETKPPKAKGKKG
ncbi:MAG: hypothetical protein IH626_01835 [Rhodospirillales bacterium]|nr:hypothetical protein [Rhodospirillales bacterium]